MEPGTSAAEKILGLEFMSDPRMSSHSLPVPPQYANVGDQYTFNRFKITPEIARDWVTYRVIIPAVTPTEIRHDEFDPNRRIQPHRIRHWDRVFTGRSQDGEKWNPDNPQGIVFSWDGFILDGQHRLAGSLMSRTTFEATVTVNAPWSVLDVMDTPMRRTAGQMTDVPYAQVAARVARHLLPAIYGTDRTEYTMRRNMREIVQITQTWPWFRNPAWITDIQKIGRLGVPVAPLGAVVFGALAAGASSFEVKSFIDGIQPYTKSEWDGKGQDPRRLIGQRYVGSKRSSHDEDLRSDAGIFRKAMTIYLSRYDDDAPSTEKFVKLTGNLPPFWNSEKIREFHATLSKEV